MLRRFAAAWVGMLAFVTGVLLFTTNEAKAFWWGMVTGVVVCVVWPEGD